MDGDRRVNQTWLSMRFFCLGLSPDETGAGKVTTGWASSQVERSGAKETTLSLNEHANSLDTSKGTYEGRKWKGLVWEFCEAWKISEVWGIYYYE